jgi:hypothetical protein
MSFFTAGVCLIASHNNRHACAAMHSANPCHYEILDLCWYKTTIRSAYSADSKNFRTWVLAMRLVELKCLAH